MLRIKGCGAGLHLTGSWVAESCVPFFVTSTETVAEQYFVGCALAYLALLYVRLWARVRVSNTSLGWWGARRRAIATALA